MLRWLLPCVVGVALLAPGTAAALPKLDFIPPFRIAGTNGYQVEIYADPEADTGRGETGPTVFVSLWNHRSQTVYKAPGRIDEDGYSAAFGRFGSVDIHYEKRPSRTVKDCRGVRRSEEQARFTGTVDFHGDRHFTDVDYPHLHAGVVNQYEQICWLAGEGGKGVQLSGLSRYASTGAFANGERGRVRFIAKAEYRLGSMVISRDLQVFGPAKDFVRSRRLRSARITPPAPFHGRASFHAVRRKHDFGRFRGNLTVDFPGFPRFPLTAKPTLAFLEPGGCTIRSAPRRVGPPVLCL